MPRPGCRCVRSPRTDRPLRWSPSLIWEKEQKGSPGHGENRGFGACSGSDEELGCRLEGLTVPAAEGSPSGRRPAGSRRTCRRPGKQGLLAVAAQIRPLLRSEEHTSELQSLMRRSYAGFCLKKKQQTLKLP